jgi:hypothetical protein
MYFQQAENYVYYMYPTQCNIFSGEASLSYTGNLCMSSTIFMHRIYSLLIYMTTFCPVGWVGHRAVLDAVVKRRISRPRRESNSRTPIVQPIIVNTFVCIGYYYPRVFQKQDNKKFFQCWRKSLWLDGFASSLFTSLITILSRLFHSLNCFSEQYGTKSEENYFPI